MLCIASFLGGISMKHVLCLTLLACLLHVEVNADFNQNDEHHGKEIIGGKEYFFGTAKTTNILEATSSCLELGMTLVSLETQEEAQMLNDFINANGLFGFRYWTSGRRLLSTSWQWTCGQFFQYQNWADGNPNYSGGGDPCVALDPALGWMDISCSSLNRFICEDP